MAELTIPAAQTPSVDPNTASTGNQRPDNVPEKFWNTETGSVNTEALLKSYAALESAQSQDTSSTTGETTQQQPNTTDKEPTSQFSPFFTEFAEKGELSEDSYAKLAQQGFTKEVVDTYIKGAKSSTEESSAAIMSSVGGEEAFKSIQTWAAANKESNPEVAELVKSYNDAIDSGNVGVVKLALAAIQQAQTKAEGSSAQRRITGDPVQTNADVFQSWDDYMAAMNKIVDGVYVYKTNETYRNQVVEKLKRSKI